MNVIINGERREVAGGTTVDAVVRMLAVPRGEEVGGGIAVAVNDEVVPRADWARTGLTADDRVDVLTAVQGG